MGLSKLLGKSKKIRQMEAVLEHQALVIKELVGVITVSEKVIDELKAGIECPELEPTLKKTLQDIYNYFDVKFLDENGLPIEKEESGGKTRK